MPKMLIAVLICNAALFMFLLVGVQQRQTQTELCKQLGGHLVDTADGNICAKLTVIPLEIQKP